MLLTPGHHNRAFYEHSFLADNMGIELVEGRDLEVDDDIVWMRTIDGRVRVDVIYRRIDDAFLDPLVFRPDSLLGVHGLMAAYLAGNVTLVNAPGTGIADDKAIYSYMPEIVRYYTGEDAEAPQCRDLALPRARRRCSYTLDNLDKLVVKLVDGSGGYGMLVGPTASKKEIEAFRAAAEGRAASATSPSRRWRCRPCRPSATTGMAPRHVDFRPFVLTGAKGVTIVPGGLTRVALRKGSLVVNSSQGGGTKDSFVLAAAAAAEAPADMLSRTASNLYWIGRYMERAEFTTRLVEATIRLAALGGHAHVEQAWASALTVVGAPPLDVGRRRLIARPPLPRPSTADNPGSIRSCLVTARDNARAARTALTREAWEAINRAWLIIHDRTSPGGVQATPQPGRGA